MINFSKWLLDELEKRGLSQAELARQSGISQSTISLVISERRSAGEEFCRGMAKGLKLPAETVFRAAGLLPPSSKNSTEMDSVLEAMRDLPAEWQAKIAEDARRTREFYEAQAQEREERGPRRATGGAG